MKLYYYPSPNPQKVKFALLELGIECETVPIDLGKQEQRAPAFLALNPMARVPVLVDGDVALAESHAILAYLGETTGRLWPTTPAGRAEALKWLFFLSTHIAPLASDLAMRLRAKLMGQPVDETVIARAEQGLPGFLAVVEQRTGAEKWMMGDDFGLVDCAYGPVLNLAEKCGFAYDGFPNIARYLADVRSRPAWAATPKLPPLA